MSDRASVVKAEAAPPQRFVFDSRRLQELLHLRDSPTDLDRRYAGLTPREREILTLIGSGSASKQIAHRLNISLRTVEVHRASVKRKMGARTIADLIVMGTAVKIMRGSSEPG